MPRTIRPAAATAAILLLTLGLTACFAPTVTPTAKPTVEPIDDGPVPSSTPTGAPIDDDDIDPDAPSDFVAVFDDTSHLGVLVPDTWTDVDGTGYVDAGGWDWIALSAAKDLDDWNQYWGEPGAQLGAAALREGWGVPDAEAEIDELHAFMLDNFGYDDECTAVDTKAPYEDQLYTGSVSTWEDCPSDSVALILTAYDKALTHEIYLELTLPGSFDDASNQEIIEQITGSFEASF